MAEKLVIAVLAGTTRVQRESIKAAHYMAAVGRERDDVEIVFVDPVDFHFEGDGNDPEGKDPKYTAIVARADAFLIVTPEYNHSFPGSLKRMLDSELAHYVHKPVAFAGASSGGWGGVRAIEALVVAVREMGLIATFTDMHFPRVQDAFAEDGSLKPELAERYRKNTVKVYDELVWMARALKWGRENLAK